MSSLGAMFDAIVRAGQSDMIWFFMACGARGLLRGEVRRLLDQPDVLQQRRTARAGSHHVGAVGDWLTGAFVKTFIVDMAVPCAGW
jgi:hypothetical protein